MKLMNILVAGLLLLGAAACSDDDKPTFPEEPIYDMTGFAKGADVSWLTQMEASGKKFYTVSGRETECMTLLRDLGMNSIRLRMVGVIRMTYWRKPGVLTNWGCG